MINIPSLSFCITCKNRFHQIKYTLPKNLEDNRMFAHLIEFVLIDFDGTDGLREWIGSEFMDDIKSGYLKYYYTDELMHWHASIAKNTSHLYANNDILMNLDCDNYTGNNGGKYVIQIFNNYEDDIILHLFSGNLSDGSYGRIGMKKNYFEQISGYDESFEPMGYQDVDLINRLKRIGLSYVNSKDSTYNRAIPNAKADSIMNTKSNLTWEEMNIRNLRKSKSDISEGHLIVNNGVYGIRENVYDIFGKRAVSK